MFFFIESVTQLRPFQCVFSSQIVLCCHSMVLSCCLKTWIRGFLSENTVIFMYQYDWLLRKISFEEYLKCSKLYLMFPKKWKKKKNINNKTHQLTVKYLLLYTGNLLSPHVICTLFCLQNKDKYCFQYFWVITTLQKQLAFPRNTFFFPLNYYDLLT